MNKKLIELQKRRRIKLKEYNDTLTSSWKKKLKRIELQIIDGQINREQLKEQHQ
jgi:uncharacterized protein (UPF0218 family)